MATNGTVPAAADHGSLNAGQNGTNLGDLASISPMFAKLQALGNEDDSTNTDVNVPAPDDSEGNDDDVPNPTDGDGIANNDNDEDDDNSEEDDADGDDSANSLPTDADIDWEYKVPVKIDGKEEYLTLEELRKGYATSQSLSAKGRELGDERKKLDSERNEKLQEVVALGSALHEQLESEEKNWATQYHTLKQKMDKAVEDGDGYEAKELKKQLEGAQKAYWDARKRKESVQENVGKHITEAQKQAHEANLKYFQENITTAIPGFDEKVGEAIRDFAVAEGIPEEILGQVYDPVLIKFINDYRLLKEKTTKGAAKRKEAPISKTTPSKKGTPAKVKNDRAKADLRGKVLLGEGNQRDELDFLKNISKLGSRFS